MPDFKFSIHSLYNVVVCDPPQRIREFLEREFNYYKVKENLTVNLAIKFSDQRLVIPQKSIYLFDHIMYTEGKIYIKCGKGSMLFPVKDMHRERMTIIAELDIDPWAIFYAIEKMTQLKAIEKGFCFFHAGGTVEAEKAIICASGQGGGKTYWALKKVEEGASFIGDDLVLVNRNLEVFPYVRGVNIHPFHKELFRRALSKLHPIDLLKNISLKYLLGMLNFFAVFSKSKNRLRNYIKYKCTIRVNIKEIFPNVHIAARMKIGKFYILIKTAHQGCSEMKKWSECQLMHFLLRDVRKEREKFISDIFTIFLAQGDSFSESIKQYLQAIYTKEALQFRSFLRKLRPSIKQVFV